MNLENATDFAINFFRSADLDERMIYEEYYLPQYIPNNIDDFLLVDEAGKRPSEEFEPRSYFVDTDEILDVRRDVWLRHESLTAFVCKNNDNMLSKWSTSWILDSCVAPACLY